MLKKINKYKTFLNRILHHKQELARIAGYDNELLQQVVRSVERVRKADYDIQEKKLFAALETYREKLNRDERILTYEIFNSDQTRSVGEVSKRATSPPIWCQFHYCLAKDTGTRSYLEIGTNLGISGSYILSALQEQEQSTFITMEGHPELCKIAGKRFAEIARPEKFEIIQGLYDFTFPALLQRPVIFDTVFIDGNHQKKETLQYFSALKEKLTRMAILIFDDINWNAEMEEAWHQIKKDSDVNYSLDLYKLGIVILDKEDRNRNINFALFLAR
jgi:predicted O-methyltransferase YrrM